MSENDIKGLTGKPKIDNTGTPALKSKAKTVNKPKGEPVVFNLESYKPMQREAISRINDIHNALRTGKREVRTLIRFLSESGLTVEQVQALKDKNYKVM